MNPIILYYIPKNMFLTLQDRISTDLIKLRNFSFAVFFLLNSLYVATIFGFQMKSENAPAESPHFSEVKYYVI